MNPYEPIFANECTQFRVNGFHNLDYMKDLMDDGAVRRDTTWSSSKINEEFQRITSSQILPKNVGLPDQFLCMDNMSEPYWTDFTGIVPILTIAQIDTIWESITV